MPELLRRSRSEATVFCSNFGFLQKKIFFGLAKAFYSPFLCRSPKEKKKKKGCRSERSANILVFYWLRTVNKGAVNRSCLWFSARNKHADFWQEKIRQTSQKFSAKMPEKIAHFFGAYREH